MEFSKWMDVSEEVQDSIKGNVPVVALESTIISHGMPFPQNLETALEVQKHLMVLISLRGVFISFLIG